MGGERMTWILIVALAVLICISAAEEVRRR